jgi:hypothetical protein
MKLRVRRAANNRNNVVQGQQTDADSKTHTVRVTVPLGQEGRDVNLSDLKKCIFDLYRGAGAHKREPQVWPKVQVSLNGKDELLSCSRKAETEGIDNARVEDDISLKSLGLCPGDLVWVLVVPGIPHKVSESFDVVPKMLSELIRVAEEGGDKAPVANIMNENINVRVWQAMVLMVHAAMLETGFEVVNVAPEAENYEKHIRLLFGGVWKVTNSVYKIPYVIRTREKMGEESSICLNLTCSFLGETLLAAVEYPGHNARCFHRIVNLSSLMNQNTYKYDDNDMYCIELFKGVYTTRHALLPLWNSVKDLICIPAVSIALDILGKGSYIHSLMMMPIEIKKQIFGFLSHRDLIALTGTCHELHRLCSEDCLWSPLFLAAFGEDNLSYVASTWSLRGVKASFRLMWLEKKREEEERNRQTRSRRPDRMPLPGFYPRHPDAHIRPGIIGGDYDRIPGLPQFPCGGFGPLGRPPGRRTPSGSSQSWRLQ